MSLNQKGVRNHEGIVSIIYFSKGYCAALKVVILNVNILCGTKVQLLTPKRGDDHFGHFLFGGGVSSCSGRLVIFQLTFWATFLAVRLSVFNLKRMAVPIRATPANCRLKIIRKRIRH